ncbi:MAG TPA: HXXEE domain-containing protein [Bacteroidales bacterium]|nr:HXXEE domain-containing protein [Bacteroidales bacterium]HPL01915.1 HXXEE domain-containing protein [Bacteroidales bacterium]
MKNQPKFKNIEFKTFPILMIILYVPFHLSEEAFFNFPMWMFEHYNLPKPLSYEHWLINNSFFFVTLFTGLIFFLRNNSKYLHFGFAILIWGLMNSFEHMIFTILDLKFAPGFFTSLLFLTIFFIGFYKLKSEKLLSKKLFLKSFSISILYWIIPFTFIISLGKTLIKIFPY